MDGANISHRVFQRAGGLLNVYQLRRKPHIEVMMRRILDKQGFQLRLGELGILAWTDAFDLSLHHRLGWRYDQNHDV